MDINGIEKSEIRVNLPIINQEYLKEYWKYQKNYWELYLKIRKRKESKERKDFPPKKFKVKI